MKRKKIPYEYSDLYQSNYLIHRSHKADLTCVRSHSHSYSFFRSIQFSRWQVFEHISFLAHYPMYRIFSYSSRYSLPLYSIWLSGFLNRWHKHPSKPRTQAFVFLLFKCHVAQFAFSYINLAWMFEIRLFYMRSSNCAAQRYYFFCCIRLASS